MAGIEFNIVAKDNASDVINGIANSINVLGRNLGSISTSNPKNQVIVADRTNLPAPVIQQNTLPIPANNNSTNLLAGMTGDRNNGLIVQNTAEHITNISDSLTKISSYLPQIIEKMGSQTASNNALSNIKEQEQKNFNGLKSLTSLATAGAGLIAGDARYSAGMRRANLRGLSGDVFGEEESKIDAKTNQYSTYTSVLPFIGGLIGSAIPVLGTMGGTLIGTALKGVIDSVVGSFADEEKSKWEEKSKTGDIYKDLSKTYEDKLLLPSLTGYSTDVSVGNSGINQVGTSGLNLINQAKNYTKNTGLSLSEFGELAASLNYLNANTDEKFNMARNIALSARTTGAETSTISNFVGTQYRMGNKGYQDSLDFALGATVATKMGVGGFEEFLSGLQGVIEQGISNGFVASSETVAQTMTMFHKLSNENPVWQGKYGFQQLQKMNSGLAGATSMSNSSQMLAYQAISHIVGTKDENGEKIEGGAYIPGQKILNTMSLMESGLRPESFKAIANIMGNFYEGDTLGNVFAYKDLFGLNTTGAMQLYNMQKNLKSGEDVTEQINKIKSNKEFQSDSSKMVDSLNDISANTAFIGSFAFKEMLGLLGTKSNSTKEKVSSEYSAMIDNDRLWRKGNFVNDTYNYNSKEGRNVKDASPFAYISGYTESDALALEGLFSDYRTGHTVTTEQEDYFKLYNQYRSNGFTDDESKELAPLLAKILNKMGNTVVVTTKESNN